MSYMQAYAYTSDFLTMLILAILPMALSYVVSYLARALGRIKDQTLKDDVATFVRWAQQTIPDKSVRYEAVAEAISARYPQVDAHELQALIESAVHEVKSVSLTPLTTLSTSTTFSAPQVTPAAPTNVPLPAPTSTTETVAVTIPTTVSGRG